MAVLLKASNLTLLADFDLSFERHNLFYPMRLRRKWSREKGIKFPLRLITFRIRFQDVYLCMGVCIYV